MVIILNTNCNWKNIYVLPFLITKNLNLQWFQYRIIYQILGTYKLLFTTKKNEKQISIVFGVEGLKQSKIYSRLIQIESTLNIDLV